MQTSVNTPAVVKLLEELEELDIHVFIDWKTKDSYDLSNVVFVKGNLEFRIYDDLFYRTTGMSMVLECKKGKKNVEYVKPVPITDDVFYQNIIKVDVLNYFKTK